jgi:carbon monoxide dehydrogenase subunit G
VRIESSFEVPADRRAAWELLMDVPRVVPCMPGATLLEEVDDSSWKASMSVKLGPIALTFATDVRREVADEEAGRVLLSANARETKGRGSAQATIESTLTEVEGGTRVDVATDLNLSGKVAQYGRGIVQDVTSQLVDRFAACLRTQLEAEPEAAVAAVAAQSAPVSGGRLVLAALLAPVKRLLGRLGGRGRTGEA